ncbi:MAG: hypothetical protein NT096_00205 [Proteobacteria bacterium]|nr:hypothetical protein [Pseudomonadota bacterium]
MDYQKAQALLKTARDKCRKPIANNTWLILDTNSNDIAVRLHHTDILTFKPDGSIILDTGGWETVTTKARMNEYLDRPRIGSERGVWMISSGGIDYFYENGMTIKPDGTIDDQPTFAERLGKIVGKEIDTYDDLIKTIQGLSIDEMVKVWKRCKSNRTLLATYCRKEFLPLTIGTERLNGNNGRHYQDENWPQIVSERLREAA